MALTEYEKRYQAQKQSDRALAQEEMFQTAADIAALDAVKTGNFDNITRGSDSYAENAEKIRAAERLNTFLRTDPADFKGKFTERQDQINEQKRILNRLEKYGYSLDGDADGNSCGFLKLFNPSSTTFVKHFIARTSCVHSAPEQHDSFIAGYCNTTTAIDGVQFKMSSGTFDGVIKLYGIS